MKDHGTTPEVPVLNGSSRELDNASTPDVSVIVPTYGRPAFASKCIGSLCQQDFEGRYEILVVFRPSDVATCRMLAEYRSDHRVVPVTVTSPGFLPALRAGLIAASGPIVAFTDDDATYPANWLSALTEMLADPRVAGAGGLISESGKGARRTSTRRIARVTSSGRLHFGLYDSYPSARVEVDFLCGANMAYRRSVLRPEYLPDSLAIHGGAPGNETLLGALVRRQGGVILCDTDLAVSHVRADRAEGTRRQEQAELRELARTRTFILRHALSPVGRYLMFIRATLVGDRLLPGLVFAVTPGSARRALRDVGLVLAGVIDGWRQALITSRMNG